MKLDEEAVRRGRRNFLKAVGSAGALASVEAEAAPRPARGKPVRAALIGAGSQGTTLLAAAEPGTVDLRGICEINPRHAEAARDKATKAGHANVRTYDDLAAMLAKEDVEAVLVATPLWTHAEVTIACLEAGKHVLCEKMMAYDVASARRMRDTAARKKLVLEIGHQRFYNPVYVAAYDGIVKRGLLGDVFHANLGWHRNASWRREEAAPAPDYDARRWGYPSFEHLLNWRLYRRYSQGLMAELGSHQVAIANWFFGAAPESVLGAGTIARYRDGREVNDHVYATFEYPGGRVATYSSIQSNKQNGAWEEFLGTKGTLILRGERDALFFPEDEAAEGAKAPMGVSVSKRDGSPVVEASATRPAWDNGRPRAATEGSGKDATPAVSGGEPYRLELAGFCAAVRRKGTVACGPDRALAAAAACIAANEAIDARTRVKVPTTEA